MDNLMDTLIKVVTNPEALTAEDMGKIEQLEVFKPLEELRAIKEPGDFYADTPDGELLVCGKCKDLKEQVIRGVIRPRTCTCELAEEQRVARENDPQFQKEKQYRIENLRKYGLVGAKYKEYTLANDNQSNPGFTKLVKAYVNKWDEIKAKNLGMLLYGDVGTGKTFYAVAIANALIDKGFSALVTNISSLIAQIQQTNFDQVENRRVWDRIRNVELLVIDDLAAESSSPFRQEQTYNIINTRYMSGKPLIVTTNLSLEQIKGETDLSQKRIFDRVLEMCTPLKINGNSQRRKQDKEKQNELLEVLGVNKKGMNQK